MSNNSLTYVIKDLDGNIVNDVTNTVSQFSKTTYTTNWPGGYGVLTTRVNRDVLMTWQLKPSYTLIVYKRNRILFQGEIQPPRNIISGSTATVSITAFGFYTVLQKQLKLRKRWIDDNVVGSKYLEVPASRIDNDNQTLGLSDISDGKVAVRIVLRDVVLLSGGRYFFLEYILPTNSIVKKVTYDWRVRTGEGLALETFNDDQVIIEDTLQVTSTLGLTGSQSVTFTNGDTNSFTFKFGPEIVPPVPTAPPNSDTFDQNDIFQIHDVVVFSSYNSGHSVSGSETYTTGELIEDVLLEGGATDRISSDFDGIIEPGTILTSFITEGDSFQFLANIITFLASYSDVNQNTYAPTIWDETGTSDNKPKFFLEKRLVDDWDYEINQRSGIFSVSLVFDELYNWVILKRTDDRGIIRYITPDDNVVLKDDDSITEFSIRQSPIIDCGQCTEPNALDTGKRYLDYHKQPLRQASFILIDKIFKKGGQLPIDVSQIRSGERIKVLDFGTDINGDKGEIFFLRSTSFNSENLTLTANSDLPPNTLQTQFFRQKQGV